MEEYQRRFSSSGSSDEGSQSSLFTELDEIVDDRRQGIRPSFKRRSSVGSTVTADTDPLSDDSEHELFNSSEESELSPSCSSDTEDAESNVESKNESQVMYRKKYQPRHRSSELNGSLTGIVRPSKFSLSTVDTAAIASATSHDTLTQAHSALRELFSMLKTSNAKKPSSSITPIKVSTPSADLKSSITLEASVEFAKSMEVHVYES